MIEPGTSKAGVPVQIENAAGTVINPATEETLKNVAGFNIATHDFVGVTYPNSVTVTYTFKTGGSGGTTVNTLTLIYVDATQNQLFSATKN